MSEQPENVNAESTAPVEGAAGEVVGAEEAVPLTKPEIKYDDFAKIDLRVGTIVECEPHPNADKLLKVQVNLGELGTRQICAGIRGRYEPEELVGKQIIVVCNLAPRKLRGEESNGMLLAASVLDGESLEDIVVLTASKEVPAGAPVS